MERIELIAPCHFGMEAVLKREILDLGYDVSKVEDGKITFIGDMEAVCYANVFLSHSLCLLRRFLCSTVYFYPMIRIIHDRSLKYIESAVTPYKLLLMVVLY